jgi:hypothetical protein
MGPVKRFAGDYSLAPMLPDPPPPDHPQKVLALGAWGYSDGVYRLTDMKTYEGIPRHLLRFPKAVRPVKLADLAAEGLPPEAEVVVMGASVRLPAEVGKALHREFAQGEAYGGFVIYLRKPAAEAAAEVQDEPPSQGAAALRRPPPDARTGP